MTSFRWVGLDIRRLRFRTLQTITRFTLHGSLQTIRRAAVVVGLLILLAPSDSQAQFGTGRSRYGLWFIPSSVDIHGIAIGPLIVSPFPTQITRRQIINGLALELVGMGLIPVIPAGPVKLYGNTSREEVRRKFSDRTGINGIVISPGGAVGAGFVNGIVVGGICGWVMEVNGVSVHGLFNMSLYLNGLAAGLLNESVNVNGLQIGLLGNRAEHLNGVQVGVLNRTEHLNGVQIGVFNECYGSLSGAQIGLLNIGPDGWMPIINVRF